MILSGLLSKALGLLLLWPLAMVDPPLGRPGLAGDGHPAAGLVAENGDLCATIDDATAARALQGPVKRDTNPQSALSGLCTWRSARTPGDALTVQVDAGGQGKYDFVRKTMPAHDLQGVGDQAFVFVSQAGFVQIGMMKGGIYVTIVLQLQNSKDRQQRAVELAQTIAARM